MIQDDRGQCNGTTAHPLNLDAEGFFATGMMVVALKHFGEAYLLNTTWNNTTWNTWKYTIVCIQEAVRLVPLHIFSGDIHAIARC